MKLAEWSNTELRPIETPKVLIADDDETTRILLKIALTQWGYHVVEARDGEEAWEILQQPDPPQILTLDWLMPKLDGVELCKRIDEKLEVRPYIIFLTRMTGSENVIQGLEAGADEFILKPFDLTELRIRVFAGDRIIKCRHQLAERSKQLENCVLNMKALAEEHTKQHVPFSDIVVILGEVCKTLEEVNGRLLENKEENAVHIQKIKELEKKIGHVVEMIKGIPLEEKTVQAIQPIKAITTTVPAESIIQHGESMMNLPRMKAFFGNDMLAIKDFIVSFITLSSEQLNEIEIAIKTNNSKSAKYYFHLLGSASGNSGIMKMYDVCGKGESKLAQQDWDGVDGCYRELRSCIEQLQIELESDFKS